MFYVSVNRYFRVKMKNIILIVIAFVLTSGCATRPEQIQATPQPQVLYGQLSCSDLKVEKEKVEGEIKKYSEVQSEKVSGGGVMFALGFLLPTMWISQASMNSDKSTEIMISNLKGQDNAFAEELKKRCKNSE